MKLYTELAEYYFSIEKINRNIDDDIDLIRRLIRDKENPSLLDLGCGTGEHLNLLSKWNIDCTGIDSSESMIRIAKLRFPNNINFLKEDLRTFHFREKFDIIISLFGSFDYLTDDSEINTALMNTWKSLKPGGTGLFEVWNSIPIKMIKEREMNSISLTEYDNIVIERMRGFKLLEKKFRTIVEVNYNYKFPGNKSLKDKHIMRAFTRDEIAAFLEDNSFKIDKFYSNSKMEPYSDKSNRIIVHFKKNK